MEKIALRHCSFISHRCVIKISKAVEVPLLKTIIRVTTEKKRIYILKILLNVY